MIVIDLIIALQKLPPNLPVMVDATKEGANYFHLIKIEDADEVELDTGEKIAMLSVYPIDEPNEN